MQVFRKILVAVDLADDNRFVSETLPTPTEEAIRQAEWVALAGGDTRIEFFYVLPVEARKLSYDRQVLMAEDDDSKSVFEHACEVLSGIAARSTEKGISTSSKVVFGRSWVELIREVIRNDIDLVIAGTRRQGRFRSMLFGSTGIKLLRKCPCPVWITKPQPQEDEQIDSILVAHDLTSVGQHALEIAAAFARERKCQLHVFHAVDRGKSPWWNLYTADQAREKIDQQLKKLDCEGSNVKVRIIDGAPDDHIIEYVESNKIELIVMGTIAREGMSGMLVGNTAEKILPFLPCSILAIKPAGFQSPVPLDNKESIYII